MSIATLIPWVLFLIALGGVGFLLYAAGKFRGAERVNDRAEAERNAARLNADAVERDVDRIDDPVSELYKRDGRR